MAMAATLGIAAAQPLLLNAWTKMPARWFAPGQRATAVGVVTVGNLVGTAAGMVLGPVLIESMPIGQIQFVYGVIAAISAVLFLVLAREHPPTPACPPGQQERALVLDGLSHALRVKAFWYVLAIAFIGLGVFNGLTTWVEAMLRPRGFSPADAGTLGAVLLLGGPHRGRHPPGPVRPPGAPPALPRPRLRRSHPRVGRRHAGRLATAAAPSRDSCSGSSWSPRCRSGSGRDQGGTRPTPEGTSNGLMQLFGQGSVVFVYVMSALRTPDGSFTRALVAALGLLVVAVLIAMRMPEPEVLQPKESRTPEPVR